ncbi:MAG TPA: PTS sugar transporter subunit IIA [Alkalispirochaeta sp.]|nr:PTS sugar transporter subunit IIA [Alkalispirochaeta sp.]
MKNDDIVVAQCTAQHSASDADTVLDAVAQSIADALELPKSGIYDALKKREEVGSTGLSDGVAVPHCSLPEAERFTVGILTTASPIDFGAVDGKPSDIFAFVAGPEARRTDHVRLLASLTAQLREEPTRERIRSAETAQEVRSVLDDGVVPKHPQQADAYSMMVVFVQQQELYEPILEAVSGEPNSSVAVSEAKSAGSILHRMPLFATFWNDRDEGELHRIEVVLPRNQINRAIRRVEELAAGSRGVQINAIDLSYGSGILDL